MANILQKIPCLLCASLLVLEIRSSASPEAMLTNKSASGSHHRLSSRNERSITKIAGEVLTRLKQIQDNVLTGAREIESLSNFNYKVFVKDGGRKQAIKDFDKFKLPASKLRHFEIQKTGTGTWGEIGDKVIVLENLEDVGRAHLIIKPRFQPQAGEFTYRILYKDGYYRPKGRFNNEE